MADKIFINGMFANKPHQNAPSFVKASVSINADDFIPFLEQNKNRTGYVNIDIKESKGGNYYAELNTWQPSAKDKEPEKKTGRVPTEVDYPEEELGEPPF